VVRDGADDEDRHLDAADVDRAAEQRHDPGPGEAAALTCAGPVCTPSPLAPSHTWVADAPFVLTWFRADHLARL
jgi:hypothetical protein